MATVPGTIDLGKFRVVYEEEREQPSDVADGYLLQQRAIIRLSEDLVKLEKQEDYTVYCDDENFKKQAGKRPSPLQYFIASIGFCMFSQFARLASRAEVEIANLEMYLCMSYDLTGKLPQPDFSSTAQGLSYVFRVQSPAQVEEVIRVAHLADKGCHMVNSLRKKCLAVSGQLELNGRKHELND